MTATAQVDLSAMPMYSRLVPAALTRTSRVALSGFPRPLTGLPDGGGSFPFFRFTTRLTFAASLTPPGRNQAACSAARHLKIRFAGKP
jgi:hypothetical protein